MWGALIAFWQKTQSKKRLKAAQEKRRIQDRLNNTSDTKEIKKLKRRLRFWNIGLCLSVITPIIVIAIVLVLIVNVVLMYSSIISFRIISQKEQEVQREQGDNQWEWVDDSGGLDDITSGGIYPIDPELRQAAMYLEVLQNSCNIVNGEQGKKNILPSSLLSVLLRETGGVSYNKAMSDVSFNITGQLMYDTPICGKSSSNCTWVTNGVSHFVGGTVVGGEDRGDPHTMPPNTDADLYEKYITKDGHALGYGQFEITSVETGIDRVYPVGDYADKVYNNDIDRYTMDSKLGFIRPNVGFLPDIVLSMGDHLGNSGLWTDGQLVWNEMASEDWFKSLSEDEKAYCFSNIQQMSYLGGLVNYDNMQIMKLSLKLSWALKADGHTERIQELVWFADKQYGTTLVQTSFNNNKFNRVSNNSLTGAMNSIMADTSLGENTRAVSSELSMAIRNASGMAESNFLNYGAGSKFYWRHGVPLLIGFESIADEVYRGLVEQINNAEKDVPSGGDADGVAAGGNYLDYIGSGRFKNSKGSAYYCPELAGIWYAQWGYKGGDTAFGTVLPEYTTTIQCKVYMQDGFYGAASGGKSWGCPAYSMAMLLSNMCGRVILPDGLPGTTTAPPEYTHTGIKNIVSVKSYGYGFGNAKATIEAMNKTLVKDGAGYQLRYRTLSRAELAESQHHLYEWLDKGAMLWSRVDNSSDNLDGGGTHTLTIAGYDKNAKSGDNYDLILLNSGPGALYTLVDSTSGQRASASKLNDHGLDYYLRGWAGKDKPCCIVIWRDDISATLPGL